ncbi:MAG TPA: NADH-quinone oxidoreductase subunit A [Thermoplasmataceae archaeon]|nr:NADH-quinone oxidoreductase subunit A [Thermoplasmatales archaeon AK]HLH86789.1 NADH-quinone oxidoreductase subunit A [Thermoplasmataceae archaeon]
MLDGYIPLLILLVLLILGMIGLFSILPAIAENRYSRSRKISLKLDSVLENLVNERGPPVKDGRYLEPYESGEVSRGDYRSYITVQYYAIILLFILFDVDMVLLFPWAMDFMTLGIIPFVETIVFIAMPLFVVYYAFKEGYMRWQR